MIGTHDMGGLRGYGRVRTEEDQRFSKDWERRAFGLNMGTLGVGLYNVDQSRYARERMSPASYVTSSYYEHLLASTEVCLSEAGVVSFAEIDERTRQLLDDPSSASRPDVSPDVEATVLERLSEGISRQREDVRPPRFEVGQEVLAIRSNPVGHSRLPAYAQGSLGRVTAVRPTYVFPDTNAHDQGEQPEVVYAVEFAATELWGDAADSNATMSIDLWESYLEPASDPG